VTFSAARRGEDLLGSRDNPRAVLNGIAAHWRCRLIHSSGLLAQSSQRV
jgi:hypothetical protein